MPLPIRRLSLASLALVFFACACSVLNFGNGKPVVVISSPVSGTEFNVDQDVAITSTSTDPQGITRVELLVDGLSVRSDPSPVAQGQAQFQLIQTWKAGGAGTRAITVRAYNTRGAFGEASVSVTVMESSAEGPTATAGIATLVPLATFTPGPPGSATQVGTAPPGCVSNSVYVTDVTIPDGSVLTPGTAFTKTWRVQNNGTCPWNTSYAIVLVSGASLGTAAAFPIPTVAPGAVAEISIPMVAPLAPGSYTSVWRVRDSVGTPFGNNLTVVINVGSALPPSLPTNTRRAPTSTRTPPPAAPVLPYFTCNPCTLTAGQSTTLSWGAVTGATSATIDQGIGGVATPGYLVVTPTVTTTYTMTAIGPGGTSQLGLTVTVNGTVTVYNFVANANAALWSGSNGPLPFPGTDGDSNGFARWVNSPNSTMEDGSTPARCLETHPTWITGGIITGTFANLPPGYVVQATDRFVATFGFLNGAKSGPDTADVTFKVTVRHPSPPHDSQTIRHAYNGSLANINWSLAPWVGQTADFVLEVDANNPNAGRDWACWVSARIVR